MDSIVKALRCCVTDYNSTQSRLCNKCPYKEYADGRSGCENKLKADAADAIEELISRVPKWISVKEKLPPSNELVIVSIYDTHGDTAFRYSSTGWLTSDTKVWVVDDEENSGVTHWMELPEMPKGE